MERRKERRERKERGSKTRRDPSWHIFAYYPRMLSHQLFFEMLC